MKPVTVHGMRPTFALLLLLSSTSLAPAQSMEMDGQVTGGGPFGMGGADYYGEIHNRMPFSDLEAERPIDAATVRRVMDERRREANGEQRTAKKQRTLAHGPAAE